jgi:phage repressor protein C with HTH and peptisase S24 domain
MWTDVGRKIRALRNALRESQAEFGDRFGVEQATVSRWEKGLSPVQRKHQSAIAELAGMTVAEFFHSREAPRLIPIVGYVSGGESFTPTEDHEPGQGIDHITLSLGEEDQVAVRVRGDSMSPVYRDGDTLIGRRIGRRDLTRALGKDCIIKTAAGEGYVKRVLPGSKRHVFRLRSYNPLYDDIEDVALEWAAPIIWINRAP